MTGATGINGTVPLFEGSFTVNGSLAGAGNISGPATLSGPSSFIGSGLQITGGVNLNGFGLTLDGAGSLLVGGNGSVVKNGSGSWKFTAVPDNYSGPTIINSGTLQASGSIPGQVTVVGGTLYAPNSGFGPFTPSPGTGPSLTLNSLDFNSGTTFQVYLSGPPPGNGYSQVQVNGHIDLGNATLSSVGGYSGSAVALVILQSPNAITGTFNGLPDGASVTLNNQTFQIHYFQPSPGFPARVVLVNDPTATYTSLVSIEDPFPQTPLLTAAVAVPGAPSANGVTPTAPGTVTFMDGQFNPGLQFVVNPLGPPVPLVNGVATFTPLLTFRAEFFLAGWSHILFAQFNPPNSSYLGSTSSTIDDVVNPVDMGWRDVMTGDFNGDGKQDIIGRSSAGQWFVGLSDGSSFTNQLWTTWYEPAGWQDVQVGDFNGDGKSDIAGMTSSGQWWVALSTGSSFVNSLWGQWSTNVTWADVKVGDFDGDGKADITGRYLEGGSWWTAISSGSSFNTSLWAMWSTAATWVDVNVGDFNGDGKADITGRYLEGGSWWTGISTGTSFTTSLWASWSPFVTWVDVKVGDFNGDGKADITGRYLEGSSWWTGISTGSSFVTSLWASWSTSATWVDVQVGDFNGDGKADITGRYLEGGSWWTAISTGSSFSTSLWGQWSASVTWGDVLAADFTGSGATDITGRYLEGGSWWTGTSSSSSFTTSLWTIWPV